MHTEKERLALARLSLEGLSVGDAFGDQFFIHADIAQTMIRSRALPKPIWNFTDDTNMALSVYQMLHRHHDIHQDDLAKSFAQYYDPARGYGPAMHRVLSQIASGESWKAVATRLFDGQGSYGNGAAMRVAPIGAYFYDDLEKVTELARQSAEITHAHPEGIAGAIAIAVGAGVACRLQGKSAPTRAEFLDMIVPYVPDSDVKTGIRRERDIQSQVVEHVTGMIGNGYRISAQDTVPFALWCAGESLSNYENAMWLTASGLGDIDTNCAIVGGVVALYVGQDGIPSEWIHHREPLPEWAFS
ncbi:MAG: ADP-ribosylglycohydrolase family protein [Anaerolineae bacterium]|nr:ADP-ribosylglycohydrolase family protein [Anaerolineae bacterium]